MVGITRPSHACKRAGFANFDHGLRALLALFCKVRVDFMFRPVKLAA